MWCDELEHAVALAEALAPATERGCGWTRYARQGPWDVRLGPWGTSVPVLGVKGAASG